MQTLGGNGSSAYGINASGQIVGQSNTTNGAQHATLWNSGTIFDLNELVTLTDGSFLNTARAINDKGQIVTNGANGHAYLLTPTTTASPEIEIEGNNVVIADGDTNPSSTDLG